MVTAFVLVSSWIIFVVFLLWFVHCAEENRHREEQEWREFISALIRENRHVITERYLQEE